MPNYNLIDDMEYKEIEVLLLDKHVEYWQPTNNLLNGVYKGYIRENLSFFILLALVLMFLLYRYRSIQNDKINYPEKYIKNKPSIKYLPPVKQESRMIEYPQEHSTYEGYSALTHDHSHNQGYDHGHMNNNHPIFNNNTGHSHFAIGQQMPVPNNLIAKNVIPNNLIDQIWDDQQQGFRSDQPVTYSLPPSIYRTATNPNPPDYLLPQPLSPYLQGFAMAN
jgi:hypothetical protein